MIDTEFIIKYTNALYSTPAEYAPRYDEFRDMFSSGQINSKLWLIKELDNFSAAINDRSAVIAGAWFGTLGLLIRKKYPKMSMTMMDIDPRCEKFINNIIYNDSKSKCVTEDMYRYDYRENLIINTSCEHIHNLSEWIDILPENKVIVLQSNNFITGNGHINCVSSEDELVEKSGLKHIWYKGKLEMPMYTRFMIIGLK